MSRKEFSAKVKAAAFKRAKEKGCVCEVCGLPLVTGKFRYDHILPDALGGEPTLENCRVQCLACDTPKTANDIRMIRKADRQRASHIGAKVKSRGFAPAEKQMRATKPIEKLANLGRKPLYERTDNG